MENTRIRCSHLVHGNQFEVRDKNHYIDPELETVDHSYYFYASRARGDLGYGIAVADAVVVVAVGDIANLGRSGNASIDAAICASCEWLVGEDAGG